MSNAVQKIDTEVTALSEKDLCAFRAWFLSSMQPVRTNSWPATYK